MNRRVNILFDETLGEDDGILKVVPGPRHEGDKHVAAESQLTFLSGCRIAKNLPFLTFSPMLTNGFWFKQVRSLRPVNFTQRIPASVSFNDIRVDIVTVPLFQQ